MRISKELVIGVILTALSVYYWAAVGNTKPPGEVPLLYRYSYRLTPYLDIVLTAAGMMFFYKGLLKLRE